MPAGAASSPRGVDNKNGVTPSSSSNTVAGLSIGSQTDPAETSDRSGSNQSDLNQDDIAVRPLFPNSETLSNVSTRSLSENLDVDVSQSSDDLRSISSGSDVDSRSEGFYTPHSYSSSPNIGREDTAESVIEHPLADAEPVIDQQPRNGARPLEDIPCDQVVDTCQTQEDSPVCLTHWERCKAFFKKTGDKLKGIVSPAQSQKPAPKRLAEVELELLHSTK
ncbi:MAG: hypothetical protein NEHIOOID_00293 [Holosporales bacterium]